MLRTVTGVVGLLAGFLLVSLLAACGGGASQPASPTIAAQPSDQSVAEGSAATFTVAASNARYYQWQQGGIAAWSDIHGAQAASYATGPSTLAMSGLQYRVIVYGETGSITSSAAKLTVTPLSLAPAITVAPASISARAGESASFFVTATGTALTYRWQQTRDGLNWSDIANSSLATLTLSGLVPADSGLSVRVVVSNSKGSAISPAALLTVEPAPVMPSFSRAPSDASAVVGQTASFDSLAVGTPTPSIRWQRSSDRGANWSDIAGASSASYTTAPLALTDDGLLFRAVAKNSAGEVSSTSARLSVQTPAAPSLQRQPQDLSLQLPATAEFSVLAGGAPTPALQWQHSSDGGLTWANINGATGSSYSLGEVSSLDNGRQLRVVASNSIGSAISRAALLRVSASTRVVSLAGRSAGPGHLDGPALDAMFDRPVAVAQSPAGTLFIADAGSNVVRRFDTVTGMVSTLAGRPYEAGDNDGAAGTARLREPRAIAADHLGNVYVVEGLTRIRKIDSTGLASTVSNRPAPVFDEYLRGYNIGGIATDLQGNVYFTDQYVLRKLDRQGQLSILAGQDNSWGSNDGSGSMARFRSLAAIKFHEGALYVIDAEDIRSVSLQGEVKTVASASDPAYAGFFRPVSADGAQIAALASEGFIYTARAGRQAFIYGEQVLGGTVIAGRPSLRAWRDGPATGSPVVGQDVAGIARDASGAVYVSTGAAIRKLLVDGSISTLAGNVGISGTLDGTGTDARFKAPGDILAAGGRLYVCDGPSVRVIDANRQVSTLARWTLRQNGDEDLVGNCSALAQDSGGTLYVATDDVDLIYKIDATNGNLVRLPHTGPLNIWRPSGIAVDAQGNVFVSDSRRHLIHRISASGNRTLWAGQDTGSGRHQDGPLASARFSSPSALVLDSTGALFVADTGNHVIRRIDSQGTVGTVLGAAGYASVVLGDDPKLRAPRRLAIWAQDQLLINATHQVLRAVVPGVGCNCAPRALRSLSGMR